MDARSEQFDATGRQAADAADGMGSGIQPRHVLDALRRRWLLIAFAGLAAGGGVGAAVWFGMPTPYTAEVLLRVNPSTTFFYSPRQTGEERPDFAEYKRSLRIQAREPMVVLAALRLHPELYDSQTLSGVRDKGRWLEKQINVDDNGAELIRVSMTGPHQDELAQFVNAIVEALKQEFIDKEQADRRAAQNKLVKLAQLKRDELVAAQANLDSHDRTIQAANREQGDQKLQDQRALWMQVRQELGEVKMQTIQLQVQRAVLDDLPSDAVDEITIPDEVVDAALADDPEFQALYASARRQEQFLADCRLRLDLENPIGAERIAEEEQKLAELEARADLYRSENLPLVREKLRELVRDAPGGIDPALIDAQIAVLLSTQEKLQAELEAYKVAEADLSAKLIERERLAEKVGELKERVRDLDEVVEMRQIELDYATPPVSEKGITWAEKPTEPDQARQIKMSGAAAAAAFGVIAAIIIWIELLTRRVSRIRDVEQDLHLPLIGSVPTLPRSAMNSSHGSDAQGRSAYWHSVLSESIDSTRTMLLRHAHASGMKTVMIASATGGEGKTSVSCHLAMSLARAGRRVLLMDCDIRRPSIHWVYGLQNSPGFCEVLTRGLSPDEVIQEVAQEGLSILPAGNVNSKVLGHLAQRNISEILNGLGDQFDFIVVDTSPILPVTDALLFAQHVDGILLSVRRDVSRVSKVEAAVQKLGMLGAPLLGAVAIGLTEGIYGSRYRYQNYAYGVDPDAGDEEPVVAGDSPSAGVPR